MKKKHENGPSLLELFSQPVGNHGYYRLHKPHAVLEQLRAKCFTPQLGNSLVFLFYTCLSIAGQAGKLGDLANLRVKLIFEDEVRSDQTQRAWLQVLRIDHEGFLVHHSDGYYGGEEELDALKLQAKYGEIGSLAFQLELRVLHPQNFRATRMEDFPDSVITAVH